MGLATRIFAAAKCTSIWHYETKNESCLVLTSCEQLTEARAPAELVENCETA